VKLKTFSYRFAEEILDNEKFEKEKNEIIRIFETSKVPKLETPKRRKRGKKQMIFTTDQKKFNKELDKAFSQLDWKVQPQITEDNVTRIKADFNKNRIQIEVQFGNMARWYSDVFKFQVGYSLGLIDVGVLIVPTQKFAKTIDENVAYYERVIRELPYAKMSLTLPIWVVGIEP